MLEKKKKKQLYKWELTLTISHTCSFTKIGTCDQLSIQGDMLDLATFPMAEDSLAALGPMAWPHRLNVTRGR